MLAIFAPLVALSIIPFKPYEPACWPLDEGRTPIADIEMAADYRAAVIEKLGRFNIAHWEVGDVILIRWLTIFDGIRGFEGDEALLNAEGYAQHKLAFWIDTEPGAVSERGYVYRHPEKLDDMMRVERAGPREQICSNAMQKLMAVSDVAARFAPCGTYRTITDLAPYDCGFVRAIADANNWRPATREELARRSGHSKLSP